MPVAALLDSARVKAPTLYYHFGDKEGLYVVWAETTLADLGAELSSAIQLSDPIAALNAFAQSIHDCNSIDLLLTLNTTYQLARPASVESVERAFADSVYQPACVLILNAVDAGYLRLEPIGAMVGAFLMGALSLGDKSVLPIGAGDVSPKWWVEHFVRGFRSVA